MILDDSKRMDFLFEYLEILEIFLTLVHLLQDLFHSVQSLKGRHWLLYRIEHLNHLLQLSNIVFTLFAMNLLDNIKTFLDKSKAHISFAQSQSNLPDHCVHFEQFFVVGAETGDHYFFCF